MKRSLSCFPLLIGFLLLAAPLALRAVEAPVPALPLSEPVDPALLEMERERAEVELKKEKNQLFLARVMPFVGMGFTLAILAIIFGYGRRTDQNRHETIRRYLEKGKPVPSQLLIDPDTPATWRKPVSDRRKGILWVAVGLGVGLALIVMGGGEWRKGAVAIIPLCIGMGYLVAATLEPREPEGGCWGGGSARPSIGRRRSLAPPSCLFPRCGSAISTRGGPGEGGSRRRSRLASVG
jgi:hypothetical protein